MCGHPVSRPCSRSMNMKHCSKMRVPRGCNYSKIAWLRQLFHLHYGSRQTTPHLSIPFPTLFTAYCGKTNPPLMPILVVASFVFPSPPTTYYYTGNMVSKQIPQSRQFLLGKFKSRTYIQTSPNSNKPNRGRLQRSFFKTYLFTNYLRVFD